MRKKYTPAQVTRRKELFDTLYYFHKRDYGADLDTARYLKNISKLPFDEQVFMAKMLAHMCTSVVMTPEMQKWSCKNAKAFSRNADQYRRTSIYKERT